MHTKNLGSKIWHHPHRPAWSLRTTHCTDALDHTGAKTNESSTSKSLAAAGQCFMLTTPRIRRIKVEYFALEQGPACLRQSITSNAPIVEHVVAMWYSRPDRPLCWLYRRLPWYRAPHYVIVLGRRTPDSLLERISTLTPAFQYDAVVSCNAAPQRAY